MMNYVRQAGRYGLWLVPLLFFGLFFAYPLGTIFDLSLRPDGQLDLTGFVEIATSTYYRDTLIFTIFQATVSTVLTIVLALPGAYVFTRYRFPGRSFLLAVSTLPFVLPTIVVATAFLALIGSNGLVNQWLMNLLNLERAPIQLERTLTIILIVHVFYNYSIALRMIVGYWSNQSAKIEEAARVLGANGWRLWWRVRLPVLRPVLTAVFLLVFIFTFTSFGVVLILGGIRFATLEVQIYYQAMSIFDLPLAAALSLVQIGLMFALMVVYTRLQKRISTEIRHSDRIARRPRNRREWLIVTVNVAVMAIFLFTPLMALVLSSLQVRGEGISLAYYGALFGNERNAVLFVPPLRAIGNSVLFALLTTLIAVIFGTISAYMTAGRKGTNRLIRWLDPLFMLPLATSAVTLGFGFIIALDEPPLNLRASWVIVPIAHSLIAIPFVIRSVQPAIRSIPDHLTEAASVLGATPLQVLRRIEFPLITRGMVVGATFAFTVSMGEFGASLFVARPDTPTMPIVIFRLLGQPGAVNYGQALAMSSLLMLVCAVSFMLIESVRTAGIGEF